MRIRRELVAEGSGVGRGGSGGGGALLEGEGRESKIENRKFHTLRMSTSTQTENRTSEIPHPVYEYFHTNRKSNIGNSTPCT